MRAFRGGSYLVKDAGTCAYRWPELIKLEGEAKCAASTGDSCRRRDRFGMMRFELQNGYLRRATPIAMAAPRFRCRG